MQAQSINELVRKHTAFESMDAMLNTAPHYRPTLRTGGRSRVARELAQIADAYDTAQAARGDSRRAFRG